MFPKFQEGDMAQPRMTVGKVKQILRLDGHGRQSSRQIAIASTAPSNSADAQSKIPQFMDPE